jgi:hypothetical protein
MTTNREPQLANTKERGEVAKAMDNAGRRHSVVATAREFHARRRRIGRGINQHINTPDMWRLH